MKIFILKSNQNLGEAHTFKEVVISNEDGGISFSRFDGINVAVGKYSL